MLWSALNRKGMKRTQQYTKFRKFRYNDFYDGQKKLKLGYLCYLKLRKGEHQKESKKNHGKDKKEEK